MAYNYTRVNTVYRKRDVSALYSGTLKVPAPQLAEGIVLAVLPKNCLITSFGIITGPDMEVDTTKNNMLFGNGKELKGAKVYPAETIIEVKGVLADEFSVYIDYVELERSSGDRTYVNRPVIGSDGKVAKEA